MKILTIFIRILIVLYLLSALFIIFLPYMMHYSNPQVPDQLIETVYNVMIVNPIKKQPILNIFYGPWTYGIISFGFFSSFLIILMLIGPWPR